ncbi:MAG: hypothetical protein M3R59_04220 [Verrucomicrobiota bacterium]|nr:hypothetical protein [Verrucomicrobiota bacterium]
MKLLLAIAIIAAGVITASAQTYTATTRTKRSTQIQQRPTQRPPLRSRDVSGVIPRAIRSGNPIQMLNPRANPGRYGTAEQSTSFDPRYPGKWRGIKLFTLYF